MTAGYFAGAAGGGAIAGQALAKIDEQLAQKKLELAEAIEHAAMRGVTRIEGGGGGGGGGSSSTGKQAGSAQQKRAQSLRLMTAGLVSLASAFIIMRAQATGKTKRSLEQAQADARAALQDHGGQKGGSGER